ncbi:hypothetical protein [Desulfosporosinus sp. OT]|uniref:hypothetical protein n=1 Tax=Desulfosporosinus sp. OT TaxID=913865 RepID=UPI000223A945|nr:hypothetical protein [Desulfosporosinus sp. OT]EGW38378.1 hypothetical protein DOT_3771 [Desulfosporosinus sp. OT]
MKKLKTKALFFATVIMISAFASTANANTVSTTEWGTFTYTQTFTNAVITAKTSITKNTASSSLRTALWIRNRETGQEYFDEYKVAAGKSSCSISDPFDSTKPIIVSSSHEVDRGGDTFIRCLLDVPYN